MAATPPTPPRRAVLGLGVAAALLPAGKAVAAGRSVVGGERLGRHGVQVTAGAPSLPETNSLSWIVADADSGEVLASYNAHRRLPPASTLKMLFADTLLTRFDRGKRHQVTHADLADMGAGSSLVGIEAGITYTVEQLWLGVFLRSGNDAVHVLCSMNGGMEKTVRDMRARARELQANDTHVVSPDGYDTPGQLSSAYDLTLFARAGLRNPDFRHYCRTQVARFPGEKGETFEIQNTNRLLGDYDGMIGVKNGYTTNAGNTFTGAAERDGRTLLVTVMHPESGYDEVYQEAADLLDWGFDAAGRVEPVGELVPTLSQVRAMAGGPPGDSPGPRPAAAAEGKGSSWIGPAVETVLVAAVAAFVLAIRRRPLPQRAAAARADDARRRGRGSSRAR
ncbi:D-alanyl-D-alanine carboxypeptidase [Actinacidiphila glaucinigra]|uniref:D-alanyl-D-alanine carboxypeptidase family protein n=1 Tax=Actinacidiphila glaucinigra TaxID=235986 RepID=UPI002DD921E0|nr:serine hydrolase [Actinacidiphila glaucinigra]WSD60503.1 D-alanyl-D-alanine carboxypeptidase [Actinacidiphila glaucinigra]